MLTLSFDPSWRLTGNPDKNELRKSDVEKPMPIPEIMQALFEF